MEAKIIKPNPHDVPCDDEGAVVAPRRRPHRLGYLSVIVPGMRILNGKGLLRVASMRAKAATALITPKAFALRAQYPRQRRGQYNRYTVVEVSRRRVHLTYTIARSDLLMH